MDALSVPALQTQLAPRNARGLLLRNPVLIASSSATGYGFTYTDLDRVGAFICKGTTLQARTGNPEPRIFLVTAGMLNAIGLENPGLDVLIEEYAPLWRTWPTPVLVNIAGERVEDFVALAERLEQVPGIAGLELNVSCPNILQGGRVFGADARTVAEVTGAVRQVSSWPLIVKLSPNAGDLRPIAAAAAAAGADALSLINTITSLRIDITTRRPVLGNGTGGLSGPAVLPIALRMVYEVASELRGSAVPVIGMGGISSASEALEFLMAGATAIELATVNAQHPHAAAEIVEDLEAFLTREKITHLSEIIGAAL